MSTIQHISKQVDTHENILYSWFAAMHTRIDIVMYGKSEEQLKTIVQFIYNKVKELEKTGNYFDSESELSIINQTAFDKSVIISPELFSMIKQALEYNNLTAGYFDITIRSDNYHNGLIFHVILSEQDSSIRFTQNGLKLDLSGFIKGYALDAVRDILVQWGIKDALVNMGNSSVMAMGNHPRGKGWKIGYGILPDILSEKEILLEDQCLTTSGNDKKERKHIINPHSNEYIEGAKCISVITENASEGEALSTALFAAPSAKHNEIVQNFKSIILKLYN